MPPSKRPPATSSQKNGKESGKSSSSSNNTTGGGKGSNTNTNNTNVSKDASSEKPQLTNKQQLFGTSWTGKTPMSLMYEHCQRQGWQKPVFHPRKLTGKKAEEAASAAAAAAIAAQESASNKKDKKDKKDGKRAATSSSNEIADSSASIGAVVSGEFWQCAVVLSKADRKTGLVRSVHWRSPETSASDQEARHAAATYALHRVNSQSSMYQMLPPAHRSLWLRLDAARKALPPHVQTASFAADPFAVLEARERAEAAAKAQALAAQALAARAPPGSAAAAALKEGPWMAYPTIAMSADDVRAIEELIQLRFGQSAAAASTNNDDGAFDNDSQATTNGIKQSDRSSSSNSILPKINQKHTNSPNDLVDRLVRDFVRRGFREAHAREAMTFSTDPNTVLEWLCAHVPDDDFPESLSRKVSDSVALSRHTTASLAREYAIQRLAEWGFPRKTCQDAYEDTHGREHWSLVLLTRRIINPTESLSDPEDADAVDTSEIEAMRAEEIEVLKSIFDSRVHIETSADCTRITVAIPRGSVGGQKNVSLVVVIPTGSTYPNELPAIVLKADLPAYIRLSILQETVCDVAGLVGSPMVYAAISKLEEIAGDVIRSPPPLARLAILNNLGTMSPVSDSADVAPASAPAPGQPSLNTSRKEDAKPIKDHRRPRNDVKSKSGHNNGTRPTNEQYLDREKRKFENPAYLKMLEKRQKLPSAQYKDVICNALQNNAATSVTNVKAFDTTNTKTSNSLVLCGETGCGKSTQVGQFILEKAIMDGHGASCTILCAQPRKISAVALAKRVADERCESVGDVVGYAVRGDSRQSASTRLLFCTTGVVLRMLLDSPHLDGITHVIVDEVHERSVDSDFLLILLRRLVHGPRRDLRVVLMSATIDADTFSGYFGCGVVNVPGFTHLVTDVYLEKIVGGMVDYVPEGMQRGGKKTDMSSSSSLSQLATLQLDNNDDDEEDADSDAPVQDTLDDFWQNQTMVDPVVRQALASAEHTGALRLDYNLIASIVSYICKNHKDGAILIFLPGVAEIKRCIDTLRSGVNTQGQSLNLLPLHANLSNDDQLRVFRPTTRADERKVVVATNIAETSITIDDVVFVIDAGRAKEISVRNGIVTLAEAWCSRAACRQRRGRAGRVRPGTCFKLFSSRFEKLKMMNQPVPEMQRVPLEQLCLQIRAMGVVNVRGFLSEALTPPDVGIIDRALKYLCQVNALDVDGNITHLGKHMATLPTDLRLAKMLVFAATFQCLDPILTITASLSEKNPFVRPPDAEQQSMALEARQKFDSDEGDLITVCKAFDAWSATPHNQRRQFCKDAYLSYPCMMAIHDRRGQLAEVLSELGYIRPHARLTGATETNTYAANTHMIRCIITAGLYPNLARVRLPEKQYDQTAHGTIAIDARPQDTKLYTCEAGRVFLHPSSTLFHARKFRDGCGYLAFNRTMATSKVYVMDVTPSPSIAVLLFGGKLDIMYGGNAVAVDGDGKDSVARFRAFPRVTVLVNGLRRFLDDVLERKFEDTGVDVLQTDVGKCLIKILASG